MLADVKKAVLYGDARRSLHIELPTLCQQRVTT